MPWGLHRHYGTGRLHFISSCYHRRPLLGTVRRRTLMLHLLEQVRVGYRFIVVGYVVMPEHVHLVISEPEKGNAIRGDASSQTAFFSKGVGRTPQAQ